MFVQWQLLYSFQLTGATDSSFAEDWCAFTVCTFYCFKQHGIFNIHTGAENAWSNSYTHIHTVGAPAGLPRQVVCPLLKCRCIIHVRYSSHLISSSSLSFSISPIVTVDWNYIPIFLPFRQTHWTTKQFLHLHAWGDIVSFTCSSHFHTGNHTTRTRRLTNVLRFDPHLQQTTCNHCHCLLMDNAMLQDTTYKKAMMPCALAGNVVSMVINKWLHFYRAFIIIVCTKKKKRPFR